MDEDYKNFIDRMGSFEDVIDLESGNIEDAKIANSFEHSGKKGMKWGKHSTSIKKPIDLNVRLSDIKKATKKREIEIHKWIITRMINLIR